MSSVQMVQFNTQHKHNNTNLAGIPLAQGLRAELLNGKSEATALAKSERQMDLSMACYATVSTE